MQQKQVEDYPLRDRVISATHL